MSLYLGAHVRRVCAYVCYEQSFVEKKSKAPNFENWGRIIGENGFGGLCRQSDWDIDNDKFYKDQSQ